MAQSSYGLSPVATRAMVEELRKIKRAQRLARLKKLVATAHPAAPPPPRPPSTLGQTLTALFIGGALGYGAIKLVEHLSTSPHDRSVKRSARKHERAGAHVLADHVRGWERPPLLDGRRPDVMAVYGPDDIEVEEHETKVSLGRQHSREQHRDLQRWANRHPEAVYRRIVTS